ncbi:MAG: GSCFA domain-containing protein [Flavobacteriales bacterium]|nr:GSCFA domain-containing protein [Flavobacteriales bacterium]
MKLSTEVLVNFIPPGITHHDAIYLIGSCFTEHIAHKLKQSGFHVKSNPHGIIYNPVSIRKSMEDVLENKVYTPNDLFLHQGLWRSFHHHGSFSATDPNVACTKINQTIAENHVFLKQARHLFITLGTAWIYRKKSSGEIVANCHKIPGYEFEKKLIEPDEELMHWFTFIDKIQSFAPEVTIHFTISPVKHLQDGFFENNLSKGLLHLFIYQLTKKKKELRYFPSYEIMQDELRDYRFYDKDLAHPNELAIEYIWEKFSQAYFAKPTQEICDKVLHLQKLLAHRIIHSTQTSHEFEIKRKKMIQEFKNQYPYIYLEADL